MASSSSSSSALVLITTLLSIAAFSMPSAEAILRTGIVTDIIYCPSTTSIISNAPVQIVCGSGSTAQVLASGLTDLSGAYSSILYAADSTVFDGGKCQLVVTVTPTSCSVNIPTGLLNIPLRVLTVLPNVLGLVGGLFIVSGIHTGAC